MANFSFNKIILGGRLTAEPELKRTATDISVTSFTIAVNRRTAKSGEQRQTDFINCVAWRSTAEFVSRYFHKGSSICVVGALNQRSWTDAQSGQKRTTYEVNVEEVNFVDSASDNRAMGDSPSYNPYDGMNAEPDFSSNKDEAPKFEQMVDDDDLPF